ncbi:MAG TPA: hypothetical protein VKZ18_01970 [Polyangia bacterium]|nr:hypothetical protein [Polyangia bacterium]
MRSRRLIEELPPLPPPPERTFWQLLPRRNFKRALLLIIAIVAVLAIKRSGGLSLDRIFEQVAPAVPTQPATPAGGFQHIEVRPAAPAPRQK